MLKNRYVLSLTLLISIPVCAMERPPRLDAKPAVPGKAAAKPTAKPAAHSAAAIALVAKTKPAAAAIKVNCAVCFDEGFGRKLACGHSFCQDCLRANIQNSVREKQTQALRCFDPKCKKPIEITDLRNIVSDKNTQNQINDIQLQEWLARQENIKHCPTPNCHFSFVNERADQFTHKCPDCKKEYCGKCLHTHESNIPCQQAERERAIANDRNAHERANREWLQARTKPCPRCGTRTEKDEGCNHMHCSRCDYHYCWNCLGAWDSYNYSCRNRCGVGTFDQPQQPARQDQQMEQITLANLHTHFARDPRGILNAIRNRYDLQIGITPAFIERFMHLSCEDQGRWAERITEFMYRNQWAYGYEVYRQWDNELNTLEPFNLTINNYYPNGGTFFADINATRPLNRQLEGQIQQWIINQNPQDLIMFNGWNCETSLTQERLQEVLNAASRHFRNQVPTQPAPDAPGQAWQFYHQAPVQQYQEEAPQVDEHEEIPVHYEEEIAQVHTELTLPFYAGQLNITRANNHFARFGIRAAWNLATRQVTLSGPITAEQMYPLYNEAIELGIL